MKQFKPIFTSTITASLVVLAGCTAQTSTNTNTINEDADVEVVTNVNETVSNENTNTSDESGEVDTADLSSGALAQEDWLTYSNEEYGFSFRYPSDYLVSTNDANSVKIEDRESLVHGKISVETADSFLTMTEQEILTIEPGKETMPLIDEKFLTINKLPIYRSLRQLKKGEFLHPNAPDSTELTEQTWTEIEYRYLYNNNLIRLSFNIEGENYKNYYDVVDAIGRSFSI